MKIVIILLMTFLVSTFARCNEFIYYKNYFFYNQDNAKLETNVLEQITLKTLDGKKIIQVTPDGLIRDGIRVERQDLVNLIKENKGHWVNNILNKDFNMALKSSSFEKFYISIDDEKYYLEPVLPVKYLKIKPSLSGIVSIQLNDNESIEQIKNSIYYQGLYKSLFDDSQNAVVKKNVYLQELLWREDSLPKNIGILTKLFTEDKSLEDNLPIIRKVFGEKIKTKLGEDVFRDFLSLSNKNTYRLVFEVDNLSVITVNLIMLDSFKFSKSKLYSSIFAKLYLNSLGCFRTQFPMNFLMAVRFRKQGQSWTVDSIKSLSNFGKGVGEKNLSACEDSV